MAHRTSKSISREVRIHVQGLKSTAAAALPFRELLEEEKILSALQAAGVTFRDRVFTPMVTLWAFLSQIISREVGSCRDAVSRVLADRAARGEKLCSSDTSSYCQARSRLPEQLIAELTRQTGQGLHRQAKRKWRYHGRDIVMVDGTTLTMADTPENQEEYPQSTSQKPGLGFPILRCLVLFSWTVGTVLDCAISRCQGKKTGEQSLFRQILDALKSGQILLGDCLFDAYRDIAVLRARGIDVVFGKNQSRHCDFRRGHRLGRDDHRVMWKRPKFDPSRFESREEWESLPEEMEMREVRITVPRGRSGTRTIVLVTTLMDVEAYPSQIIADLYGLRWDCELDLRSVKRALGMHHLQCKTPPMVRKELWMHLLAYNLIRVRMAQASAVHGIAPRTLSFTAARILIHNFAPYLSNVSKAKHSQREDELIKAISGCKLRKRAGRVEPRAIKRRRQKYSYLTIPRALAIKRLAA